MYYSFHSFFICIPPHILSFEGVCWNLGSGANTKIGSPVVCSRVTFVPSLGALFLGYLGSTFLFSTLRVCSQTPRIHFVRTAPKSVFLHKRVTPLTGLRKHCLERPNSHLVVLLPNRAESSYRVLAQRGPNPSFAQWRPKSTTNRLSLVVTVTVPIHLLLC